MLPSAIEIEGSIVGCFSVVECISLLPSGVSTFDEYSLTGDPPAFAWQGILRWARCPRFWSAGRSSLSTCEKPFVQAFPGHRKMACSSLAPAPMTATFHFNVWLFMMLRLPFLIGRGVNQNVPVLRGTSTSPILPSQRAAKRSMERFGSIRKTSTRLSIHLSTCWPLPTNAAIALVMAEVPELANSVATPRQHDDDCRAHSPLLYPPAGRERRG
jgi:hypothetical protein